MMKRHNIWNKGFLDVANMSYKKKRIERGNMQGDNSWKSLRNDKRHKSLDWIYVSSDSRAA